MNCTNLCANTRQGPSVASTGPQSFVLLRRETMHVPQGAYSALDLIQEQEEQHLQQGLQELEAQNA